MTFSSFSSCSGLSQDLLYLSCSYSPVSCLSHCVFLFSLLSFPLSISFSLPVSWGREATTAVYTPLLKRVRRDCRQCVASGEVLKLHSEPMLLPRLLFFSSCYVLFCSFAFFFWVFCFPPCLFGLNSILRDLLLTCSSCPISFLSFLFFLPVFVFVLAICMFCFSYSVRWPLLWLVAYIFVVRSTFS